MKKIIQLILALAVLSGCGNTNAENIKSNQQDDKEKEVRQTAVEYTETFSKKDPEQIASFWSPEATYVNPTKDLHLQGRERIAKEYKHLFDKKADKLEIFLTSVTFPEPGKAIETGRYRISFSDGKASVENAFRAVMVHDGKKWLFQDVRQIPLETISPNAVHLKGLEWLIGDWIDQDDDVTIETKTSWTFQNFITQHWSMKLYDQDAIEGIQIIGWDPIRKNIRSWVYDSDGGFGEGEWYEKGKDWFVKMAYTLPNGQKSSSVQIYRKVDNSSYTWASEARDVNGEILPNIPPIKIVRRHHPLQNSKE